MSKNILNSKYVLDLDYIEHRKYNTKCKCLHLFVYTNMYINTNKQWNQTVPPQTQSTVCVYRQARVRRCSLCPKVSLCDSSYSVRCHIWASSRCIRQTNMCPTPRWNHVVMQLSSIASCNHIRSLFNNNLMLNVWDRLPPLLIVLHSGKKQLNWRLRYWIFAQQNKLESYFWWKLSIHLAQEK